MVEATGADGRSRPCKKSSLDYLRDVVSMSKMLNLMHEYSTHNDQAKVLVRWL